MATMGRTPARSSLSQALTYSQASHMIWRVAAGGYNACFVHSMVSCAQHGVPRGLWAFRAAASGRGWRLQRARFVLHTVSCNCSSLSARRLRCGVRVALAALTDGVWLFAVAVYLAGS